MTVHLQYPNDPLLLKLAEGAQRSPQSVYALAKQLVKNLTKGEHNV